MPRPDARPTRRAASLAAALAVLAATLTPAPALAWGRIGHRASGRLSDSLLTPAARAAVAELLDPGESLADASTWADEVRRMRPESAPWHYVNVPITEAKYDSKFCPEPAGCVVSAIHQQRAILADASAPVEKRREALRFLAHFVQDMHQPVHVGDRRDRGGNDLQVQFFGQGSNLHRVWDSGLIEQHSRDEAAWFEEIRALCTAENVAAWSGGSVEDWADESFRAAKAAYLVPGTEVELQPGARLGEEYQKAHLDTARERLARSGVRVAAMLNDLFP